MEIVPALANLNFREKHFPGGGVNDRLIPGTEDDVRNLKPPNSFLACVCTSGESGMTFPYSFNVDEDEGLFTCIRFTL